MVSICSWNFILMHVVCTILDFLRPLVTICMVSLSAQHTLQLASSSGSVERKWGWSKNGAWKMRREGGETRHGSSTVRVDCSSSWPSGHCSHTQSHSLRSLSLSTGLCVLCLVTELTNGFFCLFSLLFLPSSLALPVAFLPVIGSHTCRAQSKIGCLVCFKLLTSPTRVNHLHHLLRWNVGKSLLKKKNKVHVTTGNLKTPNALKTENCYKFTFFFFFYLLKWYQLLSHPRSVSWVSQSRRIRIFKQWWTKPKPAALRVVMSGFSHTISPSSSPTHKCKLAS